MLAVKPHERLPGRNRLTTRYAATADQAGAYRKGQRHMAIHRIRIGLISSAGTISLAIMASGCGGAPSPAGKLMNKISGCGSIQTWGGFSLDSNTVSEGSCQLSDATLLNVYTWAAGDTTDRADFVDNNKLSLCVVTGSDPVPWAVTMQIDMYTSTFATSVQERVASDLGGSSVGGQACTGSSPVTIP